ncbi:hypothetical protein [Curtobacterium flaccumfaciens]|uniref:hypothetical protein n=1 Tax=Curtobacterium flaccumfaciens TaxID=2035 RepID=UPI00265861AF|nr:hypothetical protein [Curtobacterium flaccumfaciens]MCS5507132.1 hypothetical protein [Curtobacterium flaccumfaciens pv. flaccumfaciens]
MMLLTTDWQPWFSYGWWHDIGVPGLGAIGSIAVGGAAVLVALRSTRLAAAAASREAAADAAAQAAQDRTARGEFATAVTEWYLAEIRQRIKGLVPDKHAKVPSMLRADVDLKTALVGQHSDELVRTLSDRVRSIPKGKDATSEGQALAVIWYRYSRPTVRSWVADPERWWAGEQEDRASLREMTRDDADLPS